MSTTLCLPQEGEELLLQLEGRNEVLLKDEKYWDLTVLRVYLDNCDEVLFDDPKAGLELAKVAPRLARRIPRRRPYEWQHWTGESEKRQHRELLVRSHAVLGGAYRAGGKFETGERAYQIAREICDSGRVSLSARANLYKRLARLRSAQKRHGDALELLEFAIEVYRDRDQDYYADALLMKGYVLGESHRYAEAIPCFLKALRLVKPRQRSSLLVKRTFHSAVHNLATAVCQGCKPGDVSNALHHVREAKKFFTKRPATINKYKLFWVEGRMVAKLGSTRLAEHRYVKAFKQLLKLGAPVEAALVALELALIYRSDGQWAELEELAFETYTSFRELSQDAEALAVLRLWMDATRERALTRASLSSARDLFEKLAYEQKPKA